VKAIVGKEHLRLEPKTVAELRRLRKLEREHALLKELHADLVKRSKLAEQRVIPGASHDIQLDNPRAVIQAIRDILEHPRKTQTEWHEPGRGSNLSADPTAQETDGLR